MLNVTECRQLGLFQFLESTDIVWTMGLVIGMKMLLSHINIPADINNYRENVSCSKTTLIMHPILLKQHVQFAHCRTSNVRKLTETHCATSCMLIDLKGKQMYIIYFNLTIFGCSLVLVNGKQSAQTTTVPQQASFLFHSSQLWVKCKSCLPILCKEKDRSGGFLLLEVEKKCPLLTYWRTSQGPSGVWWQ